MRRAHLVVAVLAMLIASAVPRAQAPAFESLERAITADPENLKIAADYRQFAIASGKIDRSISFLEKLANRKGSGPNIKISLALAYVDKVPTSGDMSRLYLGHDAVSALDKTIDQRPSVLAYYVRGVISLYYNNFLFHRIPRGLEDLRKALGLVTSNTPPALIARIYVSTGDGQWRLDQRQQARGTWRAGAARFPGHAALQSRLNPDDMTVENIVSGALYAGTRVDTSLREMFP